MTGKELYSRNYFEGGDKNNHNSGYQGVGYQNFPVQLNVLDKILAKNPESLLDIGGARGYIARMFEQATGKPGWCLDISEYCHATRVTDRFWLGDITQRLLDVPNEFPIKIDLVFSIAVFEHIKEEDLPMVIQRIADIAKRGFICPSLDNIIGTDNDHTHETLKSKQWWEEQFAKYAPGWPVEIMDKEDCEAGDLGFTFEQVEDNNKAIWTIAGRYVQQDMETLSGKNERKLVFNIGSYVVAWRSTKDICVVNTDVFPTLHEFMKGWGANYTTYKAPERLNVRDNSVDEINVSHMFEHLTRQEGGLFLKECLRVLKQDGRIRIAVPDLHKLAMDYLKLDPEEYDFHYVDYIDIKNHGVYNENVAKAEDSAQALWHMITSSGEHKTAYDSSALIKKLLGAGFKYSAVDKFNGFTHTPLIAKVGWDMYPESSLYVEGWKTF